MHVNQTKATSITIAISTACFEDQTQVITARNVTLVDLQAGFPARDTQHSASRVQDTIIPRNCLVIPQLQEEHKP
jgi:hypothetical protein